MLFSVYRHGIVTSLLRHARAGKIFAARGVKFTVPPLPKRMPSPDEPGLGYDPTGVRRYYDTEVFIEDYFLPDGRILPLPERPKFEPLAAGCGAGEETDEDM